MRFVPAAIVLSAAALTASLPACAVPDSHADEYAGVATAAIASVPAGVDCIEIVATGNRVAASRFDVTAGASSILALTGLPVGAVAFSGKAYPGACSAVSATTAATWIANPVTTNLTAGVNADVTLDFRRNGTSTVTANFDDGPDAGTDADTGPTTQTLVVALAGTGVGRVTSAPAGIDCGSDCSEPFTTGAVVTLTALPQPGSTFARWSGGGCTGTGTCVVTMSAASSVTATFSSSAYSLTVARAGTGVGTVASSPAGINCGSSCSSPYAYGTTVTLTATPATGSSFTGWSGGGCSGTGTCTVSVTAATTVTASFTLSTYPLTVTKAGSGAGIVSSTPAGISCGATCAKAYAYGTSVTLTATSNVGSTFTGWSGACTGAGPCTVNLVAAKNVTANFAVKMYTVTIARSGNGTVTSAPVGLNCGSACTTSFPYGTSLTLTESASGLSFFSGWSGPCSGSGAVCAFTVMGNTTVNATFVP